MTKEYDLIIVGGGSAGLTAAAFATQLGVQVAVVERGRTGGDCTWTGCVPSKTFMKIARVAHQMRTADKLGLHNAEPEADLKSVMVYVKRIIDQIYQPESAEALRDNGIDVLIGNARFLSPNSLAVGDTEVSTRHFILATGAHPYIPPIKGLKDVDFLTYESIWELEALPEHLIVLGGGPIGCEIAQAFNRLGSEITLIEAGQRLLPRDETEASNVIAGVFRTEGINLYLNMTTERVWQTNNGMHLMVDGRELEGDALFLAVGRHPNIDGLDLKQAGVTYSDKGIEVDDNLRTSQRHIYAAGDCIGGYQFTHYAGWQAAMAVRNAFLPGSTRAVLEMVPWTTFTEPEVAHAGLTEPQAREKFGEAVLICDWPMELVDRAQTEGDTAGFLKVVYRSDGTVLGATIVAGRAGEMINEWIIAIEHGLKVGDIAQVIHVYPTYSMASMQAAADMRVTQLLGGTRGKIIRKLVQLMR